jgi:hypothetical protein
MADKRAVLRTWFAVSVLAGLFGCAPPNSGQQSVRRHLEAQLEAFTSTAERWAQTPVGSTVNVLGDRYRWNEYFITPEDGMFKVDGPANEMTEWRTLDEAARHAGTTSIELDRWVKDLQALGLYSLTHRAGYIEMIVAGTQWQPRGLRYAPKDDEESFKYLIESHNYKVSESDYVMAHIFDRWFYFEADHL